MNNEVFLKLSGNAVLAYAAIISGYNVFFVILFLTSIVFYAVVRYIRYIKTFQDTEVTDEKEQNYSSRC